MRPGVHAPDERPFLTPWGDGTPKGRALTVLQRYWAGLGTWTPNDWGLGLVAFHEGRPIGGQSMRARDFGILREVTTGSWLGLEYQRKGLGTQMRAAILHLAFAELGCVSAITMSFLDNNSSLGVTRKFGYREDGIVRDVLDGEVGVSQRFRLGREDWEAAERPEVTVSGLDACREMFGV